LSGYRSVSFGHKNNAFRYGELVRKEDTPLGICVAAKAAIEGMG
jgi:hypothetical protein